MWNSSVLVAPPVNTFKAKSLLIDIDAIAFLLNNAIQVYSTEYILKTELALLFQFVYRMKLSFRNDKGFKLMEKAAKVLQKLLNFNIATYLKSFLEALPTKYEKDFYLPTKQMLEYLLVRLQGFSKLSCRVAECSKHAAILMIQRLYLGQFWKHAALILASTSRIWYITKKYTEKCCLLYNTLLPLREKFEINGIKWLPDDYIFPTDLVEWLNVSWIYQKADVDPVQLELQIYNLLDDSDNEVEFCHQFQMDDCYIINDDSVPVNQGKYNWKQRVIKQNIEEDASLILIDDDDNSSDIGESSNPIDVGESSKKKIKIDEKLFENSVISIDEDVGEFVSISSDDEIQAKKKKKSKKKKRKDRYLQSLNPDIKFPALNTLKELNMFLKREHKQRNKKLEKCFTKTIADKRWLELYYQMSALKVNAEVNPMKTKIVLLKVKLILQNALQEVT